MTDRRERASYLGVGFLLGVLASLTADRITSVLRATRAPIASPARSSPRPGPGVPSAATSPGRPPATPPPSASAGVEPEWTAEDDALPETLSLQHEQLWSKLRRFSRLGEAELAEVVRIFQASRMLGQGNPKATTHPMTRAECRALRARAHTHPDQPAICGKPFMVPIYDRQAGETESDARLCIDQFEFPDIPCEYPVTWVRGIEVARLCRAVGKRICDTHEWEGACAGSLRPVEQEYSFEQARRDMRFFFNQKRQIVWAYGPQKHHEKCGTGSRKGPKCDTISWKGCGSNTYPAGAFPECVSPFGVYDQHGNAAEHMNLPLSLEQLASRGDQLGETEMKGSWFIFQSYEAHEDDCRWRAPDWHGTRVMDIDSHSNYHLGFRCCRDVVPLGQRKPGGEPPS